ncbi:MAG: hypothetical protein ABFD81_12285 [Syntrophaceae bacterium]
MAKPGKKAELDKDGIKLPDNQSAGTPGKVELDKDGIALAKQGKVDLDKDGIPLANQESSESTDAAETPEETAAQKPASSRRTTIIIAAAALSVVVLLVMGVGGYLWHKNSQKSAAVTPSTQSLAPKPLNVLNAGEITLDPFMVLYTPQKQGKAGLLMAEVVLSVNPKTAANVRDRQYEIRALINETLNKNVEVYTQFEITEMLKESLRAYDVSDVTFTRYDLK